MRPARGVGAVRGAVAAAVFGLVGAVLPSGVGAAHAARLPICYEGGNDNRVQLVFATGTAGDGFAAAEPAIRAAAAGIDRVLALSSARSGGFRRVRWVTDASCRPTIERALLTPTGSKSFRTSVTELEEQGFQRPDRKYLVFADTTTYCGISGVYADSSPGPANANNGGHPQFARVDRRCWGTVGSPPVLPAAHELVHTLGAVQGDAPHATAWGHCTDGYDLLCRPDTDDGSAIASGACPPESASLLDCNGDDYFSTTSPRAGTYLATHWNVASSSFLTSLPPIRFGRSYAGR